MAKNVQFVLSSNPANLARAIAGKHSATIEAVKLQKWYLTTKSFYLFLPIQHADLKTTQGYLMTSQDDAIATDFIDHENNKSYLFSSTHKHSVTFISLFLRFLEPL